MLSKLISDNYEFELKELKLVDRYFGTEIYLIMTNKGKYIVKAIPPSIQDMENEGHITEYLYNKGISVARLLKTNNNMYHVETEKLQFHVQEFVEGKVLKVNTAPDWFLDESASIIGKVHAVLKDYHELETNFAGDFFTESNVNNTKAHYAGELNEALESKNKRLIDDLEERIKHLERIAKFNIDANKLTYSNSHGDFHIGQIIANGKNLTVIDWTTACRLPICIDIITPYVFSAIECKYGKINSDGLKRYINNYSKHFTLNDYDIKIMPYIFYFNQMLCNYSPPYNDIPETYLPVCELINGSNSVMKWLYENVENLSRELHE